MMTPVTFHAEPQRLALLDALAKDEQRNRDELLNEAMDCLIDLHQWQKERIEDALRDARAGNIATDEEVEEFFKDVME